MEFKDYYKTLGVSPSASADEIRKAYRKLARRYHPDRSKEPDSEDRFKEVGEAYEALKDPEKRAHYDQLRAGGWRAGQSFRPDPAWNAGSGGAGFEGFGDFSDFFEALFGGMRGQTTQPRPGQDVTAKITIDLPTAYRGGKRRITINRDDGPHSLDINIPAGITSGRRIRLAGQGGAGSHGGPAGNLFLEVEIAPHPEFELDGRNVLVDLPIAPWEAALGAEVNVPTLGGRVSLKIPPGSSSGKRLRLAGRGLQGKPVGDQIVRLQVVVPEPASEREKALYEELSKVSGVRVREH
ncbi:MAG TPA: J domain-containing protein [Wenzhouxiangella sp.]|nr:J domain-containing protein [Wenzhouxiangella sp.]